MNYIKDIQDYIALEIEVLNKLDAAQIDAALNLLDETRKREAAFTYAAMEAAPRQRLIFRMILTRAFLNILTFRSGSTA